LKLSSVYIIIPLNKTDKSEVHNKAVSYILTKASAYVCCGNTEVSDCYS
jgi:hypothetical protein